MTAGVDYAALSHAYGSAADVPGLLERLASGDRAEREAALDALLGSVHHQGDIYDSTIACIPPLCALATAPSVPDRHLILALLDSIGESADGLAGFADGICDPEAFVAAVEDPEEDWEELSAVYGLLAQRALRERLPALRCLLDDSDPSVRAAAASLLGGRDDHLEAAGEALVARVAAEEVAEVRQALAEALGDLAGRVSRSGGAALLVELGAALGDLAATGGDPGTVLGALTALASNVPEMLPADVADRAVAAVDLARTHRAPQKPPAARQHTPTMLSTQRTPGEERGTDGRDERTCEALSALHRALGVRVADRQALVLHGLRYGDPGGRFGAVNRAHELYNGWRVPDTEPAAALLGELLAGTDTEVARSAARTLLDCRLPLSAPLLDAAAEIAGTGHGHGRGAGWEDGLAGLCIQLLLVAGDPRAVQLLGPLLLHRPVPERLPLWCTWLGPHAAGLGPALMARFMQCADELGTAGGPDAEGPLGMARLARALADADYPRGAGMAASVLDALADLAQESGEPLPDAGMLVLGTEGGLGAAGRAAVPVLRRLVTHPSVGTRVRAVRVLWHAEQDAEAVLPVLARILDEPGGAGSRYTCEALELAAVMGAAARPLTDRVRAFASSTAGHDHAICTQGALTLRVLAPDDGTDTGAVLSTMWGRHWWRERGLRPRIAAGLRKAGGPLPEGFADLLHDELTTVRRLGNTGRDAPNTHYDCAEDDALRTDCAHLLPR